MKKQLCLIFAVGLTCGVTAQTILPVIDAGTFYTRPSPADYKSFEVVNGANILTRSGDVDNIKYIGTTFARDDSWLENYTTSDGSGVLQLGVASSLNSTLLLHLGHNLSGRIYYVDNHNPDAPTPNLIVDASLNPESTITGKSTDAKTKSDDNAVTFWN